MNRTFSLIFLMIFLTSCSQETVEQVLNEDNNIENDRVIEKEELLPNELEINGEAKKEKDDEEQPKYTLNEQTWYIEPIDASIDEQVVLITIDDAPDEYSLDMAHILKDLHIPAIFFVNGHFLETEEQKEILKEIDEMGFVIGNHTYSHKSLPDLSEEEQLEEIITVNDQVEAITGKRPQFFRAPFGQNTDYTKQIINDEQMVSMNWSYGYDWNDQYMEKDALTDVMINANELRNGANLLMHDRKWTYEALEDIVLGLREKGYDFIDPLTIKIDKKF